MSDPNDEIYIEISRAAMQRLIEGAWHDSASATAGRVLAAIERRNAVLRSVTAERSLYEGVWTQFLTEDGVSVERECNVVVSPARGDVQSDEVVAMTIVREGKERDASAEEFADALDCLRTNDVFSDPEAWDLNPIDDLPAWAADQVHERAEARAA